jgi:ABC-2 type transport system permease protein
MNTTFPMLLRRELWEHRALWIAPLVFVGLILVMFTWGTFKLTMHHDIGAMADAQTIEELRGMSESSKAEIRRQTQFMNERGQTVFAFSYLAISAFISMFMSIVVFFYLIDCLFAERRDRSILFWKSLPVSDTQVVLSKFTVAMVVVPIGVLLLSAVFQLLLLGIWNLRFGGTLIGELTPDWNLLAWLRSQGIEMGLMLGSLIWYAPIAAYFMLLSVWARRLVFLWAILPLFLAPLLEKLFLGSEYIGDFISQRFAGHILELNIDEALLKSSSGPNKMPRVEDLFAALDMSGMFTSLEAWLGMAAAAVLLYATIRIRRYRDET